MERIDDLNIQNLKIIQNTDYFLFGMDSVLLANKVKAGTKDVVVDLGTGSLVIPVILSAKTKAKKIIGIELQEKMYDLALRNLALNKLENTIDVLNLDLKNIKEIKKKILEITGRESVDIVVCNPPYKEKGTGTTNLGDVKYVARHEEKCTLEDIFYTSSKILKSKGRLYIVHKPERLADLITFGRKYNLEIKNISIMQPSENKRPSIVLMEYVLDGGNECKIEPVLMEYDEKGNYTKEIKEIYSMEV